MRGRSLVVGGHFVAARPVTWYTWGYRLARVIRRSPRARVGPLDWYRSWNAWLTPPALPLLLLSVVVSVVTPASLPKELD